MKNKVFFLYISDSIGKTVKDSQVINWLKVIGELGYVFNLIIIVSISRLFGKLINQKAKKVSKVIPGEVFKIPIVRNNDKSGISNLILFVSLFCLIFIKKIQHNNIVIQTRLLNIYTPIKIIKKSFSGITVIFDHRGARAEEYLNSIGIKEGQNIKDKKKLKGYKQLLRYEQNFVSMADYTFCVSNKLKDHVINKLMIKNINPDNLIVIPGGADEKHFYFSMSLRDQVREELGINDELTYIYTGTLDRYYQKKEMLFEFIASLLKERNSIFFICITPDEKLARVLQYKFKIPNEKIYIKYIEYISINKYLCAADYGIIFRDDIYTNNVASPTKVAEYLLSGLPVIISKNVGDFSSYISTNNLGFVIDNNSDYTSLILNETNHYCFDREFISKKSKEQYSKQSMLNKLDAIYSKFK